MKKKFSKILGVGLTLALLASLLLTAAPVSALSSATVTADPATISAVDAEYSIFFTVHEELEGDDSEDFILHDAGDALTITDGTGGDSGTITVTSGSVLVTPAATATIDDPATGLPVGTAVTIIPGDGAVDWATPAGADSLLVTASAATDHTTGTWTTELGTTTSADTTEIDETPAVTVGVSFALPDVGDGFTITDHATVADSGTITVTAGSVTATPAGAATIAAGTVAVTITPASGAVAWTAPGAGTGTIVVVSTADHTAGTWTQIGGPVTAPLLADVVEDIVRSGLMAGGDSMTITFPDDTTLSGDFSLPDVGDAITILDTPGGDSGVINITSGTVNITGGTIGTTPVIGPGLTTWSTTAGQTVTIAVATGSAAVSGTLTATTGTGIAAISVDVDTDGSVSVPLAATITGTPGWVGIVNTIARLNGTWTHDVDELTLTYTMAGNDVLGSSAEVMVNVTAGITNPTEPDDYSLEIETSEEDAVESAEYEIEVPDVDALPGIVQAYNSADVLMDSDTGAGAIQAMLTAADEGWTIKIGEGEYTEGPNTACADITIEGSGDLEDIVIVGNWTIDEEDVTLDNLTLDGDIIVDADDFIIQNCAVDDGGTLDINAGATDAAVTDTTFDVEDDVGIAVDEDDTVITGCTFTIEEDGVGISVEDGGIDTDVSDGVFTGSSGIGINVTNAASVLDVEDSTFDNLDTVLDIDAGTVGITGSTIEDCAAEAVIVTLATSVTVSGNTFTGNDAAVLLQVAADAVNVYLLFNTIINNVGDEDLLIDNNDTDVDLIAVNNWWGDAAGPGDDAFSDDVVSEPFLAGAISVTAGIDANVAAGTIADFEDDVGVTVVAAGAAMDVVAASEYLVNPVAAISNAVGFWDVYVIGGALLDDVEVRIYTDVTEDTEVWVWGEARGEWLEATSYTPNLFSGFILVEVDSATGIPMVDDLEALPFAVIEPAATAGEIVAPSINAPVSGDDTVSLTPTFAWAAGEDAEGEVAGADGYYFELADNANFVLPLVKLDGDTGRLIVSAYAYVGELPYSTAYYWRVRAVTGTVGAGDLVEGDWASAVFITMDEPEEPIPPVVIEEAPVLPDITITQPDIVIESPDIIVPLPAVVETPITPSWIYVIIGVGAVLVIALLVLIVRTRRVA